MPDQTSDSDAATGSAIRRPPIVALMAISALNAVAVNMILPSLPALQRDLDAPYERVQLILSLYLAAMAVAQIFIGPFSDRFGRRPVLLIGFTIFAFSTLAAAFGNHIDTLIALRIVQGATASVGLVLGRAIVRDLYERRQAASMLGYVTMGLAIAPMLAPFIGGLLHEAFGWRSIFYALTIAGIGCFAVTWYFVPETNRHMTSRISLGTMIRDFGILIRIPDFLLFTFCSSLTMGAFFSYLGGVPYISAHVFEISPVVYGAWFGLMALGYSIGSFLSGRFAETQGVARLILAGSTLALSAIGLATIFAWAGTTWPPAFFLPMSLIGVANGLSMPTSITGAISVRPQIAGAAAGLSGACQIGTGAALSAFTGAVVSGTETALPLLAVLFTTVFLAALSAVEIWRRSRRA